MSTDCLLQFQNAANHLKLLESEIASWIAEKHYTIVTRPAVEPLTFDVIANAEAIPLDPYALLISSVLHSLRSGLDHVAYALALRYSGNPLPADVSKSSQFPIFGDIIQSDGTIKPGRQAYRDAKRYIKGIDPAASSVIEQVQPYHRGTDFRSHPLWILNELSNIDKHRLLHPAVAFSGGSIVPAKETAWTPIFPAKMTVNSGILEKETVIVRYKLHSPQAEINLDFHPAISFAFPLGGPAEGQEIVKTLVDIYRYILDSVISPLAPFL